MRWLTLGLLAALACAPKQPSEPSKPATPVVASVSQAPAEPVEAGPDPAEPEPEPEPALEPEPEPEPPAAPLRSLFPGGFVAEPASEATCTRLAAKAMTALETLDGPCTSAHDCELVRSACPLGCFRAVSKLADASKAQKAVDAYFAQCRPCKTKCAPAPQSVACAENRCFPSP